MSDFIYRMWSTCPVHLVILYWFRATKFDRKLDFSNVGFDRNRRRFRETDLETDVGFAKPTSDSIETDVGFAKPTLVSPNQRRIRQTDVGFAKPTLDSIETDVGFDRPMRNRPIKKLKVVNWLMDRISVSEWF